MALVWILFFTIKTLGSYIIPVEIFYQLLIQMFSFLAKIYLPIDNTIITIHLIMLLLPSIFHIQNWYFDLIKSPWLLNSKQQPHQFSLKRYRERFYRRRIKIRKFIPTNNQTLEKTNKAICPMKKRHPEINWDLLSNLHCYLDPKKQWRKNKVWHRLFQDLCRLLCLILCNTWQNWFHSGYS